MTSEKGSRKNLISVVILFCLAARNAHAYIDPNAAGLLYQIFFPVIIGITLAWRWVKETCKLLVLQLWSMVIRRRSG